MTNEKYKASDAEKCRAQKYILINQQIAKAQ
jgi:hypothetical protein